MIKNVGLSLSALGLPFSKQVLFAYTATISPRNIVKSNIDIVFITSQRYYSKTIWICGIPSSKNSSDVCLNPAFS
ncbi:hypothetical protein J2Z76_000617 [Sedimentibacter acidaminivorans]|uniref:Uncharacterized protein n=1 Tax=Sedimentibacter acidaminivorans TaxID=913099 RepID=A0ABS4GAQ3_9FIRM|nr:hypothetical protein [Sedimentibacter acidaminivorans]